MPVLVGIRGISDEDVFTRERRYGVSIDAVTMFQTVQRLHFPGVQQLLNKGKVVQLVLEFSDSFANLQAIADGKYDSLLLPFAAQCKADGRKFWLRPLHELNGSWYSWCIFKDGNSVEKFKAAWGHVVKLFRNAGAPCLFQLCYNNKNPRDAPTDFRSMYPGDALVDAVGFNVYNRNGLDQWHTGYPSLQSLVQPVYTQLASMTTKPLFIGEVSATSYGGDKRKWIADGFAALRTKFPRIQLVNWFLESKIENGGILGDWDLTTPQQEQAWVQGCGVLRR